VVTDIEMPRLDGLGLVRRIRADKRTASLPIIALTSLAGEDDIAREIRGHRRHQTKLDRDRLLERLREYFGETARKRPGRPAAMRPLIAPAAIGNGA